MSNLTHPRLLLLALLLGSASLLWACDEDSATQGDRWRQWLKADVKATPTALEIAEKNRPRYPGVKEAPKAVVYDENNAPALDAAIVAHGKTLYTNNACWTCHGNDGDGKGPAGLALPIKPTAFVAGVYKYGSTPKDVYKILTKGSPNPASGMAPYAHIPPKDRWALAYYVTSFSKKK